MPGLLVALVDHLDARPRARSRQSTRGGPIATTASTVGAGVSTRTAAPRARGTFERDVTRVPRRRTLVLQRFVALVEHDDRARGRAPVPTPRCGRRSPRTRRPRPAPTCAVRTASAVLRSERHHLATLARATARELRGTHRRRIDHERRSLGRQAARSHITARRDERRARYPRATRRDTPPSRPRPGRRRSRGSARTRHGGSVASGPAQRHAAQRQRSTTSGGGPADETASTSRRSVASGCADVGVDAPSRAPAGRAAGRARWCPTATGAASVVGEEVVEPPVDGRDVGLDPKNSQARDSAAFLSASAWSVRSHVKSRSLRPKCPYAAVCW